MSGMLTSFTSSIVTMMAMLCRFVDVDLPCHGVPLLRAPQKNPLAARLIIIIIDDAMQ
jgi:hypothetical protein